MARRRREASNVTFPPSRVDSSCLRALLDTLRALLAAPSLPLDFPWSPSHDGIAAQLKAILERLRDLDVNARYGAALTQGVLAQSTESRRLALMLNALQNALARRVHAVLGPRKLEVLAQLLAEPIPSLLDVLNRADNENAHSDVLAWLLSPKTAPQIAPAALARLVAVLDDPDEWARSLELASCQACLSVRREFVIGREWTGGDELDRLDIVISGPDFVLVIENKIQAPEHRAQTMTYWRWLETLPDRHAGFFLTPSGRFPSAPGFRALSYLDLLGCLLEAPARGAITREERTVLAAYAKTLERHVLRSELRTSTTSGGSP